MKDESYLQLVFFFLNSLCQKKNFYELLYSFGDNGVVVSGSLAGCTVWHQPSPLPFDFISLRTSLSPRREGQSVSSVTFWRGVGVSEGRARHRYRLVAADVL